MERRPGRAVSRLIAVLLFSSSILPLVNQRADAQSNLPEPTIDLVDDEDIVPDPIVSGAVSNVPVETYPGLKTYSGIIEYHRSDEIVHYIDGIALGKLFKYNLEERTYYDAVIKLDSGIAKITTSVYDHAEDDLDVCADNGTVDFAMSFTSDSTTVQNAAGPGIVKIEEPYWSHGNSINYRYDLSFDSILEEDDILHLRRGKTDPNTGNCKVEESVNEYTVEGKRLRYRFSLQGIREPDGSIRGRNAWPGTNFVEAVPGPDYDHVSQFNALQNDYAQTLGVKKKVRIYHEVTWDLKPDVAEGLSEPDPMPGVTPIDEDSLNDTH